MACHWSRVGIRARLVDAGEHRSVPAWCVTYTYGCHTYASCQQAGMQASGHVGNTPVIRTEGLATHRSRAAAAAARRWAGVRGPAPGRHSAAPPAAAWRPGGLQGCLDKRGGCKDIWKSGGGRSCRWGRQESRLTGPQSAWRGTDVLVSHSVLAPLAPPASLDDGAFVGCCYISQCQTHSRIAA